LIDINSLMSYQQQDCIFRGSEHEGNITVIIKRHRIGIEPVGGVVFGNKLL